jgi:hypothetical protein
MATSPINKLFRQSEALSRLQDHANRLIRLQKKLDASLPAASRGAAQVANLQDGELTLHATSPVMATRIKLSLQTLKANLQAAGEPVQTITVKVRVNPFLGKAEADEVKVRPIGEGGRDALLHLAQELEADDPLAKALKRIVDRSSKG